MTEAELREFEQMETEIIPGMNEQMLERWESDWSDLLEDELPVVIGTSVRD